jgi:predicted DNA-binding transcriptional regulator AlpA
VATEPVTSLVFWSSTRVAEILGVPKSTVDGWRSTGIGPTFTRIGKHVRYQACDVIAWIEDNKHVAKW